MTGPLILYLRPFTSDGKVRVANPEKLYIWRNLMPTSSNGTQSTVALEEVILQSCIGHGLLIAFGKTVEVIGAGKVIARDDEWQELFIALTRKASCILSVPSMHPSTVWELDWIARHGLQERVIFVFTELHFSIVNTGHFESRVVREYLQGNGWKIPEGLTSSTLLSFQSSGSSPWVTHDSRHKKKHLQEHIRHVVARE